MAISNGNGVSGKVHFGAWSPRRHLALPMITQACCLQRPKVITRARCLYLAELEIRHQWATLRPLRPASAPGAPPGGGVPDDEVEGGGLVLPAGLALELEAGDAPASFFAFGAGCTAAGATVTGGAMGVGSVGVGAGSATVAAEATSATAPSSADFERRSATIPTTMPRSKNKPPKMPASMTS
jgi:hypothetical protein